MMRKLVVKCSIAFLSALLLFTSAIAQSPRTVQGKVTSQETNGPLAGVNVSQKGTTNAVVTDTAGNYTITLTTAAIAAGAPTLVFSYVGYTSQELPVDASNTLSVILSSSASKLDEVVVIGYGTQRRRDLTGSVYSIKAADIVKTPTFNPVEALQGRVPGVDITRSSGVAGASANVSVRGNRSISGVNGPLYIIDGFQGGNPNDINPNDIESIEVLKDASATAIYGSQGANGVFIITTKKGSTGKSKVTYDAFYGVNGYTSFPKGRIGQDYVNLRREAYRTVGQWNSPADDYRIFPNATEYAAYQAGQFVDWYDIINRNGTQQSHTVSVSGGNDKTKAYLSLGYYKEEGQLRRNDYSRYNLRFNVDHTISKWAKAGINGQLAYINLNSRLDPLSQALTTTPLGKAYDSLGNILQFPVPGTNTIQSPIIDERGDSVAKNNTIRTNILANGYVELTPLKGLTFRSNFGVNLNFSRQGIFYAASSLAQRNVGYPLTTQADAFTRGLTWDNILTYNTTFGDHSLTVTGIESYIQSDIDNLSASGRDQLLASQLYYNLGSTSAINRLITSGYTGSNNLAFAGRINYSFKGKYLLSVTGREDGASRLAPGHKWDFFPSVSAGWNISQENFMKSLAFVSNLKLRGSYGTTGNYGINVYGTQSNLSSATNIGFGDVQGTQYFFQPTVGNPDFEWEKTSTTNIGLDFGLLRNRITGTVDAYQAVTNNVILLRNVPLSGGLGTTGAVYQNVGQTKNRGIEIGITSQNIQSKNFNWSSTFTFTSNKERITKLINGTDILSTTAPETGSYLLNRAVASFYSYKILGIWQTDELSKANQLRVGTYRFQPGDIKIQDLNGDSLIDTRDRQYLGSNVPKFSFGLQNNFSFKEFDVGIYLFVRYGQMINAQFLGRYNPSGDGNGPEGLNYWTPENSSNDFPRPRALTTLSSFAGFTGYQALPFVDGSYFKIKTLTLGYTLPKKWTSKIASTGIRFYATANNVFTKAKSHLLKNYDPEGGGAESGPLTRQVVFGTNINF
jgi:TonB-linked SusC/RagA family outer membrane protein